MPYRIKKVDSKWAIVNKETGKTVGTSTSKEKAESSARDVMGS